MINTFIKSSFGALLKLHEVMEFTRLMMFTHIGTEIPDGEEQAGFCYTTTGSIVFRGG